MATASNRDVRLGVEITTANADAIKRLGEDFKRLAKEGGDAAPEFTRLASEMDRLATEAASLDRLGEVAKDVDRLATEQAQAAAATAALAASLKDLSSASDAARAKLREDTAARQSLRDQIRAQTNELQALRAGVREDGVTDDQAKARKIALAASIRDLKDQVIQADAAVRASKAATADAAAAESKLQAEYNASAKALSAVGAAVKTAGASQREAQAAATALGVAFEDLAAAQARVVSQAQAAQAQGRIQRALMDAEAEAARQAALESAALAEARRRGAAAAESELAALRDSEQFLQRYTASQERAKQEALEFVTALDRESAQAREAAAAHARLNAEFQRNQARAQYVRELESMFAAQDAAADKAKELQAAINGAFGSAGLRSLAAIDAEVRKVDADMGLLRVEFEKGAISAADFNRAVGGATVRLSQLRAEAANIPALPGAFEQLNTSINNTINKFGSLTAAVATVGVALRPIIEAEVALQATTRILTQVTGSSAEAARQIAFLRDVAQRSGTSFTETSQAYAKFAASALQAGVSTDNVKRSFEAVALASGNLGVGSEQAKRALEALSQIASKGVVSMEELRQQLGDALPGVFPLLARELGLTTKQLTATVEAGGLLASEAIPAIARALRELGPQNNGTVSGMAAEWARFKNVLSEAGTALLEGPLGRGAGAALQALAGIIRDVSFVAVSASNGIQVLGKSLGVTAGFVASGMKDFETYKRELSEIALQAAENVEQFKRTAYAGSQAAEQMGSASTVASGGVQSLGAASTAAASATTSVGAAAASATAGVQSLGAVSSSTAATVSGAEKSYAALNARLVETAAAADLQTQLARKHTQAVEDQAKALATRLKIVGDEVTTASAAADAARLVADAKSKEADAQQRELDVLGAGRGERAAYLKTQGETAEKIREALKPLDEKIAKQTQEVEKSKESAAAAKAEAAERSVASERLKDNSARYVEFSESVDRARANLATLMRLYLEGKRTVEDLAEAEIALNRALALQGDALQDAARKAQLRLDTLRVENQLSEASATVKRAEADATLSVARATGDVVAQANAEVQVKRVQVEQVQAAARAKVSEANATIELLAKQREAITGQGLENDLKRAEIDLRIRAEQAKIREAAASKEVVRGLEAEIDAMLRRNQTAAAAISDPRLTGVRSAGGQANRLAADGGANLSVLTPNNAPAVDNSFAFQVRDRLARGESFSASELAALQNGLATARNNASLAGGALIPSLTGQRDAEDWVNVFRRAIESIPTEGTSLGNGFGPNTPNVVRPAARTVNVNFQLPNGQTATVPTDDDSADNLVRALESSRLTSGL